MKLVLSETPKTGFVATRPNYYDVMIGKPNYISFRIKSR